MNLKFSMLFACFLGAVYNVQAQSPEQKSSPKQLVEALHTTFGEHHARAVHTKGIILKGDFTPDGQAKELTKAFHLQKTKTEVTIRFSDFTGIPDIPDNSGLANPRGLAIKFTSADGATTDIVGHSFNGFPTSNTDDFRELLLSIAASGKDAAKPTKLDLFLEAHPIAKTFLTTQKNPASFGGISYFGVNSFKFTNVKGKSQFVRYQFIPENGEELITNEQMAKSGNEYLFDELKARIAKQPIVFKMYAQLAEAGDQIENPSVAWPESRKKVLLGTIRIKQLSSNTPAEDKALAFNPNNIPAGIETADPMLTLRAKAYPISVKERQ